MIINQAMFQKIDRFGANKVLILRLDKLVPGGFVIPSYQAVVIGVELEVVAIQILNQLISPHHFRNLHQLVIVILPIEKWIL